MKLIQGRTVAEPPAVSVIIPAYNAADFISETLDSVFQQSFTNFEVIVVNDGSLDTQKLEDVLGRFRNQITYMKHENRGVSGARNTAITQARGDYLAFLDSDDTWHRQYLEKQIQYLEGMPGLDAVYCDTQLFGDVRFAGQTLMQLYPSIGPVTLESLLTGRCQVCTSCVVARRNAVIEAGLFDERFRAAEDWDLWLRMLHRGGAIAYHRGVLGRRRLHPGGASSSSVKMIASMAQVLRNLDATLHFSPPVRSLVRKRLQLTEGHLELEQGKLFLEHHQFGEAEQSLQKAKEFFPSMKLDLTLRGIRTAPNATRLATQIWTCVLNCIALISAGARFAKRLASNPKNSDPMEPEDLWAGIR